MSKKRNLIFLCLLILGVLLLSSCFLNPPVTEGILKGQVIVPEGTVQAKDLTGQALPDATVNIIDLATGDIIATTTTDANGYYQVFVPDGGPYLLEAVKDEVKVQQITCQVEVGIEYDLGIADCSTTAVALITQAMLDAEDYPNNPADINLSDIEVDPDFDDVMSIVCSAIEAGEDPALSAVVQQAVEDFLHPPTPTPTPTPLNDAKAITAFDFKALDPDVIGVINEGAKTIALTVPFGTVVTALVPTIVHTGASVSPAFGTAQNFTSPVNYTVTAEDTTTAVYTVTVTVALNDAKAITAFDFIALDPDVIGVINEGAKTIALTVPFGTVVTALVPTIVHTGASVSPLSGAVQDFSSPVNYTVTAEDTTTAVYTVTVTVAPLVVGDSYGGGIIAYIDGTGQHGLIAATADQRTAIAWITGGSTQTTWVNGSWYGGTSTDYGTGQANTNAMMAQTDYNGGAAKVCDDYTNTDTGTGVYSDWFLPSKDELDKLYINKVAIDGFADISHYWSSSEGYADTAWVQDFSAGYQGDVFKYYAGRVRAVRAF